MAQKAGNLSKEEQELLDSLSTEEPWQHMKWMIENVPNRVTGTKQCTKQAEYLQKVLEGYGLKTTMYKHDSFESYPGGCKLKIIYPEARELKCRALSHIPPIPEEGLESELVHVGSGGKDNYEGKDVDGKITLSELSYAPPCNEKMRVAELHGSIGQVQMNWGLPEHDVITASVARSVWGTPTPETMKMMPKIPGVMITKQDGEYLKSLLQKGPVRVWMWAEADNHWTNAELLCTQIDGNAERDKFVLLGGHMDAWPAGTTCNAAGDTTILELAKGFAKLKGKLRRSLRICFWEGHENYMSGSSWYVDNFWDDLRENCVLYFNCDSPGMIEATHYMSRSTEEAEAFHRKAILDLFGEQPPYYAQRAPKIGDQSFFGIGISSLLGRMLQSPELQKKWGNATLGWWYHSSSDTLDKCDKDVFEKTLHGYAISIYRLLTLPVLPFEFVSTADVFMGRLVELNQQAKGTMDFSPLIERARNLRSMVERLKKQTDKVRAELEAGKKGFEPLADRVNATLLKLSRILLPIGYTYWGIYAQDLYGAEYLNLPIPVLHQVPKLATVNQSSEEFITLRTKLVREKNWVSDSLKEALWHITQTSDYLESNL